MMQNVLTSFLLRYGIKKWKKIYLEVGPKFLQALDAVLFLENSRKALFLRLYLQWKKRKIQFLFSMFDTKV